MRCVRGGKAWGRIVCNGGSLYRTFRRHELELAAAAHTTLLLKYGVQKKEETVPARASHDERGILARTEREESTTHPHTDTFILSLSLFLTAHAPPLRTHSGHTPRPPPPHQKTNGTPNRTSHNPHRCMELDPHLHVGAAVGAPLELGRARAADALVRARSRKVSLGAGEADNAGRVATH
jgi:hypothetical protein